MSPEEILREKESSDDFILKTREELLEKEVTLKSSLKSLKKSVGIKGAEGAQRRSEETKKELRELAEK